MSLHRSAKVAGPVVAPAAPAEKLPTWVLPMAYYVATILSGFLHKDLAKDVPLVLAAGAPLVTAAYAAAQHYFKAKVAASSVVPASVPVAAAAQPIVVVQPAVAAAEPATAFLPPLPAPDALPPLDVL